MAWQNLITGAANGAINPLYGTELSRQRHEASQQHQRLGHMSKQELAQAIYSNAELYGGTGTPVGRQLHAMVPQVTSLPDDGTLDQKLSALAARHAQLVSQGEQQLAQSHAGAGAIQPVPKATAPTVQNSNPFASVIGQATQGAFPGPSMPGPIAAQPATNPLTSPAGGGSSAATFPAPTPTAAPTSAPGPLGSSPTASPEPVPSGPGVAASNVGSPAAGSVPPLGAPPNIQPDIDEFNTTGYMSPVLRAMIPGQIGLHQGQQLLQAIQPILDNLGPVADQNGMPDVSKLMRMEAELSALGVKGGSNMAPLLLQMLSPRSEAGMQPWSSLSQKQKDFYIANHPGEDVSKFNANDPFRVISHKYSGEPLEINRQSQTLNFKYGPNGEIIPIENRTGEALPAVAGANGAPGPINPAFVPITRNGISYQWVDFGDHKELLPLPNQNTSQRGTPPAGATGAPAPPLKPPTGRLPGSASLGAPVLPSGPASSSPGYKLKGVEAGKVNDLKNAIELGAHQLWGDPDNPSLRPLAAYANLADDPGARQRLGKALKLVLDSGGREGASHIGTSIGPVSFSAGGIGEWLTNELGVPQATANQRATIIRGAIESMKPEEVRYFNSLMNAIPTITGMRRLTGGSAFRWSQEGLERELPMIGLAGVTSSETFRQKMAALGDEPLTAIKNLQRTNPGAIDPRLVDLIRSGGGFQAPGQVLPIGVPKLGEQFGGGKVLHVERVP